MNPNAKIEFGDFQTPSALACEVCLFLTKRGIVPDIVLEPTCGVGAFLTAAAQSFSRAQLLGWDIDGNYVEQARLALNLCDAAGRSVIVTQDFFKHDWEKELSSLQGNLLILGNLPWVTNARVSSLNGSNVPAKENFQGLRGMAARTGKSNFDISEWMLIQLMKSLQARTATIAMLCKTAIARKLLRFAWLNEGRITKASLHRINAKKHFGASVEACLLLIQTGSLGAHEAELFEDLNSQKPSKIFGLAGQELISNLRIYKKLRHLDGNCSYRWRSGVKHDCSSVMELWRDEENILHNKLDESIDLEPDFLFPLLKCSDLANGRNQPRRFVLVTQTRVGEDTSRIFKKTPRMWRYLQSHLKRFDARKSSIYGNGIPFAIFGIGEYSFSPWKVAVSGLHKTPRFIFVEPFQGRPVLFDDTCYFLPFHSRQEAEIVTFILNSEPSRHFISSLLFEDSKRPITVELLQRLNLRAIAEEAGLANAWKSIRNQKSTYIGAQDQLQVEFVMERADPIS